jgi:adenine phosphoribosyltransferase
VTVDPLARAGALVRDVPDYPQPGVVFKDITPLLADADAFRAVVEDIAAYARARGAVDAIAGVEARGFILAAPVALELGVGFVPVRKQGKLPWDVLAESYELEYGAAVVEVHTDGVHPGSRVLVVDDVLATGGTAAASMALVERAGGTVAGFAALIEIGFLGGRERLPGRDVHVVLGPQAEATDR